MTLSRWLVLLGGVAAVAAFIAFGPNEQTVIRQSAAWRDAAREHFITALAIFFVAEVAVVALSLPIGIWMTLLAGFLFGVWVATAVVAVSATLGAVLAFLAARYAFADALRRAAESRPRLGRVIAAMDRGLRARGAFYVLLLRLTPVFPFWMLNLGLGLTRVRLRDFTWATLVGVLPMTMVVANAGASLAEVTTLRDVVSFRVLGAMCLLPLVAYGLHRLVRLPVEESASQKP
jgi:uncharacterized membrane protein YdjX (TVP38/TMEM64 family)